MCNTCNEISCRYKTNTSYLQTYGIALDIILICDRFWIVLRFLYCSTLLCYHNVLRYFLSLVRSLFVSSRQVCWSDGWKLCLRSCSTQLETTFINTEEKRTWPALVVAPNRERERERERERATIVTVILLFFATCACTVAQVVLLASVVS